jgi:hypothetical protein
MARAQYLAPKEPNRFTRLRNTNLRRYSTARATGNGYFRGHSPKAGGMLMAAARHFHNRTDDRRQPTDYKAIIDDKAMLLATSLLLSLPAADNSTDLFAIAWEDVRKVVLPRG